MRLHVGLVACFLFAGCIHGGEPPSSVDPSNSGAPDDRDETLDRARAWVSGDPVPPALLEDRPREGCIPRPSDTLPLYADVDNVPLLIAVVESPAAAAPTLAVALERALQLRGPTSVFGTLDLGRAPAKARARAAEANAWIANSVWIDDADMEVERAQEVLQSIAERLQNGEAFEAVYRELAPRYSARGSYGNERTFLRNLGSFVVSPSHPSAEPLRDVALPEAHVKEVLGASPDDVVIVQQEAREGAAGYVALYDVREIYRP